MMMVQGAGGSPTGGERRGAGVERAIDVAIAGLRHQVALDREASGG